MINIVFKFLLFSILKEHLFTKLYFYSIIFVQIKNKKGENINE